MGAGYIIKCSRAPFCKYEMHLFTGVGMDFPSMYKDLVRDAKAGLISEEHTVFFRNIQMEQ